MKCPKCEFENEDGALFCEHCKSDLAVAEPALVAQAAPLAAASNEDLQPDAAISADAPLAAVALVDQSEVETFPLAEVSALAVADDAPDLSAQQTISPPAANGSVPVTAPDSTASPADVGPPEDYVKIPAEAKPRLVVIRGQRIDAEYPLYEGENYLGRADEKAVDVDLEDQEPPDRIWSSRQHALITLREGVMALEDLNSTNGTFVNRLRLHPGQKRYLQAQDVIQIGTVQLRVMI
jgi:hypothetical protein